MSPTLILRSAGWNSKSTTCVCQSNAAAAGAASSRHSRIASGKASRFGLTRRKLREANRRDLSETAPEPCDSDSADASPSSSSWRSRRLTIAAVITELAERRVGRERAEQEVLDSAQVVRADVRRVIESTAGFLVPLARDLARHPGRQSCERLLGLVPRSTSRYSSIGFATRDGTVVCGATRGGSSAPARRRISRAPPGSGPRSSRAGSCSATTPATRWRAPARSWRHNRSRRDRGGRRR